MTAKLLSFTQSRGGWGNVEMAQFARIQRLLENVGLQIDVEHGVTDEGDPWCVFCSNTTGDVVIHAACINGVYMFDSPVLRTPIEGRSFQHCAEKFLDEAMQAIPVVRRRSTLQVHPSALLASVFLTIVLHAQATSEHSPFRAGDGHGDPFADLDPAAKNAGWLKLIAQHLAELFGPHDPSSPHQNQQLQNWVSAIPVGLTVSVLGIVHELVIRDDRLMLVFDNFTLEGAAGNTEHDSDLVAGTAETSAPDANATAAQDAVIVSAVADAASEDTIELRTAEAKAGDLAPTVTPEQGLSTAYLALAHAFVEEVIAFASDTVAALAGSGMTMTAQADNGDNGDGLDVSQTETQQAGSAINTIAAATIALLKPLMESGDTIEFISIPDDAGAAVVLAAYDMGSRPGTTESPLVTDGDGTVISSPAIEMPPPPATADAPARSTTSTSDVIAQLDWLIDVADNVAVQQSGGNYIIFDKDAMFIDQDDRLIETFVMEDHSEITFIGVAADFDGLFV